MSTYILIHGSWNGSWCWEKVAPLLEKQGHRVITPDLSGHGQDKTPIPEILLQTYVDRVLEILDAQPEPVILVGHSMGGIVISQAAEYRPDKIKILVYLCAILLRNGQSCVQVQEQESDSLIKPNLILPEDQSYVTLREEAIKEIFYEDCSDEDVVRAKSLMVLEPAAPITTPISITEENFGRVPRVYIECLHDRAISPSLQKKMYTALSCLKVISMNTSHSPFFSAPEELATHLTLEFEQEAYKKEA